MKKRKPPLFPPNAALTKKSQNRKIQRKATPKPIVPIREDNPPPGK
jgi:hypothetical protein